MVFHCPMTIVIVCLNFHKIILVDREVSEILGIQPSTVSNILKRYRATGQTASLPKDHVRTESKLSFQDSLLLETIVSHKGSTSLKKCRNS